jgi:flavin reductase (DIM6/NTAB) family NADH-FMN oxidoreductase RutF
MRTIDPKEIATGDLHQLLVGAVAPRPIAFASTVDENGTPNLAPYSFFNVFSSNPPILVFSSNRKRSDNSTKDTLHNVEAIGEVVINVVTHNIAWQAAVASIEYPQEVSEFEKAGFTPVASDIVKPFRVKESPVNMECKVQQIIPLGDAGGAGHLIICEVVRMHLDEVIFDERGRIDPHRIDLMGRMGRAFYVRASGEAIHRIYQPVNRIGIGFDQLPKGIRESHIFSGNNLAQFASLTEPPGREDILAVKKDAYVQELLSAPDPSEALHRYAQKELAKENVELAARLAWLGEEL